MFPNSILTNTFHLTVSNMPLFNNEDIHKRSLLTPTDRSPYNIPMGPHWDICMNEYIMDLEVYTRT